MFGVPPTTPLLHPPLLDGRCLSEDGPHEVVIALNIANDEHLTVGDTMTLRYRGDDSQWTVVGIAATTGDRATYGDIRQVSDQTGTPGLASALLLQSTDPAAEAQDAARLGVQERLKHAGVMIGMAVTRQEIMETNQGSFNFIIGFMLTLSALLALVGGLGLASTMSLNVLERTREIGVMRGVGAGNGSVRAVVVTEGVVIAVMSWALGIPVSAGLAWLLTYALGIAILGAPIPLVVSPQGILLWLPLVILLAAVASLLPAQRAARISVREALAYE